MSKGTGITGLDLDHDQQDALKNKIRNFDEADIQKAHTPAQGKDYETVTISSRSLQIGRKLQTRTKAAPPPGFNISPDEDPYITSGLTQEYVEDEDISILGGALLALDPAGDNISLLGDKTSLIGNYAYSPSDASLGYSTATGHTSASIVNQVTSLLTQ